MSTSILPPLPTTAASTPVDVDSLGARQARNLSQVTKITADTSAAMLAGVRDSYIHMWGQPVKTKATDGTVSADPANRKNENNLSPAEAIASYGTGAQAAFAAYAATLTAVHAIYGDAAMAHPVTGEDMSAPPTAWSVTFGSDGSGTVSYMPQTA